MAAKVNIEKNWSRVKYIDENYEHMNLQKLSVASVEPVKSGNHNNTCRLQVKFDDYQYDALSIEVWSDNYKAPNETTREEVWKRTAKQCASVEKESLRQKVENNFLSILYNDKFVPGGRILANLGVDSRKGTTLYNCFVHSPIDLKIKNCDSIDGIYSMLMAQAKTLKSEGGYGTNASWIRPEGSYVKGIGSRTPGVLKFMELWDKSSEIITQGSTKILGPRRPNEKNKIRKGAQMLVLDVWHPDIEEFIIVKQTPNRLTKFNVSVGITTGFMEAVINNGNWDLKYPDTEHPSYDERWFGDIDAWTSEGLPVIVHKVIKARELWDTIMLSTYERNEPGVLFLDITNKLNPAYWFDLVKATNPCGEIGMSTGVCNLASLNLPMFVIQTAKKAEFDYKSFADAIRIGIRFLDNINDISETPLPEYKQSVIDKRRIGLGVMGLGSLHAMLGIRYGSKESVELTKKIFKIKSESELLASAKLGVEKGSFRKFDKEKYFTSFWWQNLEINPNIKIEIEVLGAMRNSHQSMNAPTGNTGIYARNVSGGIEPIVGLEYTRWTVVPEQRCAVLIKQGFEFPDVHSGKWFETKNLKWTNKGDEQILKGDFQGRNYEVDRNRGLVVASVVEDYGIKFAKQFYGEKFNDMFEKGLFATTVNLTVKEHLDVLKTIAHYVNMSVSKTVNIPNEYAYDDFKSIYLDAWKSNIKGITTYRAGTMTAVLEANSLSSNNAKTNFEQHHAPKRPETLPCDIHHMQVRSEKWNFFVGLYDDKPYEIFAGLAEHIHLPRSRKTGHIRKNGTYNLYTGDGDNELIIKDLAKVFDNATESAFTRTTSLALRHGVPVQYVVEQIEKGADKENEMFSLAKGLMRVLKHYIKNGTRPTMKKCQKCNSKELAYQEGCITCQSCGHSKCG